MNLKNAIKIELALSRNIIRAGGFILPRFEIYAPTGRFNVVVEPSTDENVTNQRLGVVRGFMILKAATAFTLAGEIRAPTALTVLGVTRTSTLAVLQEYKRSPVFFGAARWTESLVPEIVDLLPHKVLAITHEELTRIEQLLASGAVPGITWQRK